MKILDKLFKIVFARYRRKLGDSNIQSAWFQASTTVTAYLGWSIASAEGILLMLIYSPVIKGTALDSKGAIVTLIAIAGIAIAFYLGRDFRRYASDLPVLLAKEARAETRFVFWFRAISVGAFVVTCLIGFVLHKTGILVLQGLK